MLESFIRDYSDKAYQFAFRLSGNAEEAKELVQEAFYRAINKWDQYDESQPLEAWFLTILRNLYYDGLKRYERRCGLSLDAPLADTEGETLTLGDSLAAEEEGLLERLERDETGQVVRAALETLSADQRAVIDLADGQGLSYEEIACVLDCPAGTVRSRLNRARSNLRKALLARGSEVIQ